MTAIIGATIGAVSATQGSVASPSESNTSATAANPNIAPWERTTESVLDFVESPEYNYGVMGTFASLAVVQGAVTGYAAAASAAGGACAVTTGAAAAGIAQGVGMALAPLAVGLAAGIGGFKVGEWAVHGIADMAGIKRVATEGEAPARVGDDIAHQRSSWGVIGAIAGVIAGVAVVAAIGILTGGVGLVVMGSAFLGSLATVGAAAAVGGIIAGVGNALGQYGDKKGEIMQGSPNVMFNGKAVARAGDIIQCSDHTWSPPPVIAQGAKTVFANGKPIARLGHKTNCDGNINSGSGNIVETQQTGEDVEEIKDSRNIFLRMTSGAINTVFIAMGLKSSVGGVRNSFKQLSSVGEPVDIVTGDFLQQWPVIELPGILPLTLNRTYRSTEGFIINGSLGSKWASSWSQHLDIRSESIDYLDDEGVILTYHTPENDVYAVNLRQPNYILSGDRLGELVLFDRQTQRKFIFEYCDGNKRFLNRIEDGKGNWIHFSYNENALCAIEHSAGYSLQVETEEKKISSVTLVTHEFRQVLLTCKYNAQGHLVDCHSFQFGRLYHDYNDKGFMVHWRDTDLTQAYIAYDDKGRVTSTRTTQGYYGDQFIYDDLNNHNIYVDAEGGKTHYYYNEMALVTKVVDPLGEVTSSEWDLTRLTRTTDELGRVTSYQYNALGDLLEVTLPDDSSIHYKYNANGQITEVSKKDDQEWHYQYDDAGLLRKVLYPAGLAIEYRYDSHGNVVMEKHSTGREWRYRYGPYGQLSEIVEPGNIAKRCHFDVLGRLLSVEDALGQQTVYLHSIEHARPGQSFTEVVYPDNTRQQIRYDSERRIQKQTDGEGKETTYQYGAFDLLLAQQRSDGKTISYHYDRLTRLTGLTNASGESYRLIRDAKGRVIEEQDFTGRCQHYVYDAVGRLSRKQSGQQIATYRYSLSDQLIQQQHWLVEENVSTLEECINFTYDQKGQLVSAVNNSATVVFDYNEHGELVGERINGREITYQRDADTGQVINQNQGSTNLNLSYDADTGRLEKVQLNRHEPLSFEYDPLGREKARNSACGFVLAQNYTKTGLLFSQAAGRNSALFKSQPGLYNSQEALVGSAVNRQYEYDKAFNITGISDGQWGEMRYHYNANDQIVQADLLGINQESTRFEYDENLNLSLQQSLSPSSGVNHQDRGNTLVQFQEGGRVVDSGRCRYRYNAQGQLIEKNEHRDGFRPLIWKYRWNGRGQLIELLTPERRRWRYAYDAFGRRIRKFEVISGAKVLRPPLASQEVEGGDVTQPEDQRIVGYDYFWRGEQMVEEIPLYADGTPATEGGIQWLYQPGAVSPFARYEQGKLHYVVSDHLGTARELFNEQGKAVWLARNKPWGRCHLWALAANDDDRPSCQWRFPGQYEDSESGLHYNRFRYYDPQTAQYISSDPIGLAGGLNPYGYVHNPVTWIDPLGLVGDCGLTGAVNWKSFNPNKRDYEIDGVTHKNLSGLQYHYLKHGKEFGDITQVQYLNKAKDFSKQPLTASMQEGKVGNFVIRHDKSTGEVFIGHAGKREMRTYYKDDGRDVDAFRAAMDRAGELK